MILRRFVQGIDGLTQRDGANKTAACAHLVQGGAQCSGVASP
jgi:hypothetical protein